MNRERKYRAWDGEAMYLSPALSEGMHHLASWFESHSKWDHDGEESIIMDFTDLIDKYDNDIFESDILEFVGGTCDILPCGIYADQYYKKGQLLFVKKLQSGFTLMRPDHINETVSNLVGNINNYWFWNHARSFIKRGNIYENPELVTNGQIPTIPA